MKTPLVGSAALAVSFLVSQPADDPVHFDAVILPFRTVHVGARTDGILEEVSVAEGELVEKGQVLGRLAFEVEAANARLADARRAQRATLEAAKARLETARSQLVRREELYRDGIVTPEELEEARTAVRLEELAVQEAEERRVISQLEYERAIAVLEQGILRAPLTGVVREVHLSAGEMLGGGDAPYLVTLVQLDPLRVEVHLPIQRFPDTRVGSRCRVRLESPLEGEREGRVSFVDQVVDTASDTFRVVCELPNPDYSIPAGLRCRVAFEGGP